MNKKKSVLFIGAMKTELYPLLKSLHAREAKKLHGIYPLYIGNHHDISIHIVETFVGDTNAAIAGHEAIRETDPDIVIKFGAVGGSYPKSKSGDIIIPMGFFHRTAWITRNKKTHEPTSDASKWDSVFGEKDYQIQESRNNLGGMPYYFPADKKLIDFCKRALDSLNMHSTTAYVGGGNMWMFDKRVLDNVAKSLLPQSAKHRRFVSDMESYVLAHTCFVMHKPFIGCYTVASNDYLDEIYNPMRVSNQMKRLVPYALKLVEYFYLGRSNLG